MWFGFSMVSESWGWHVSKVVPFGIVLAMIKASNTKCQYMYIQCFGRQKCVVNFWYVAITVSASVTALLLLLPPSLSLLHSPRLSLMHYRQYRRHCGCGCGYICHCCTLAPKSRWRRNMFRLSAFVRWAPPPLQGAEYKWEESKAENETEKKEGTQKTGTQ